MRGNRRAFLRGLGGLTVGLPLLDSLQARAQTGVYPRRLVIIYTPNGVVRDAWFPTAGANERDFLLGPCLSPLQPFKDKLLVLDGMHLQVAIDVAPGEPHQRGMGALLTGRGLMPGDFVGGDGQRAGWGSGISVDQYVHQLTSGGRRSLQMGVRTGTVAEVRNRLSYMGAGMPLPPVDDPVALFDDLFTDLMTEPEALRTLRLQRRSVLDTVQEQFGQVLPRLSGTDRRKLDQHFTLLRELETRLTTPPVGALGCQIPDRPPVRAADDEATMAPLAQSQMDVLAAALACDQARVATVQISSAINALRYPWAPVDSNLEGHMLSHMGDSDTSARQQLTRRHTWHAEQVAYLLARLAAIPEGAGSVLDNTLVWWCNELSVGNAHSQLNMPFVLAGSCGGFFDTGRFVTLADAPHHRLLLSILRAFDIPDATFGLPEYCGAGPQTQLHA